MVDDNPGIEFYSGSYVNDPRVIGRNDNFVSVNSGLAVDLTGQVCSESIGSQMYSGSGGQCDFAEGANYSKGGRNIICVKGGQKERFAVLHCSAACPRRCGYAEPKHGRLHHH